MLHRLGTSKADICHCKEEALNEMLEMQTIKGKGGGPGMYEEEYAPCRRYVDAKWKTGGL